jgi:hypothetical protein
LNIREYAILFWTVVGIVTLLVASPALSRLLVYPQTEFFTEVWLLGPSHMAEDYPFNITSGQTYNIYVDLANHLGHSAYYVVEVKFRNETQSMPSSFGPLENRTPSSLPSLFNVTAFVGNGQDWELPLAFSLSYSYNQTLGQVDFQNMTFNNAVLSLAGYTTTWNSTLDMFLGNLFLETWIYNSTTSSFQYHARWVGLQLNMTST